MGIEVAELDTNDPLRPWRRICGSHTLLPGAAERFEALVKGETRPCVVIRLPMQPFPAVAYVNICAHRNWPVVTSNNPLDFHGRMECRAHGALYDAATGECVVGPCVGERLVPIRVEERDGGLWVVDDDLVDDSIYAED